MHRELENQEEIEFKNSDVQRRSMAMKVRKMRVVSCCALEQIAWMCGDQERSLTKNEDIQYLKVKTHSTIELFRKRRERVKRSLSGDDHVFGLQL